MLSGPSAAMGRGCRDVHLVTEDREFAVLQRRPPRLRRPRQPDLRRSRRRERLGLAGEDLPGEHAITQLKLRTFGPIRVSCHLII